MQKSSIRYVFISVVWVLLFSACTSDSLFLSASDKLIGEWNFERVKFHKNWSFHSDDITDDYKKYTLVFHSDNTLEQINATDPAESMSGEWTISSVWNSYSDEDDDENTVIEGYLYKPSTGETFDFYWEDVSLTKHKLHFREYFDEGTYRYKLHKE